MRVVWTAIVASALVAGCSDRSPAKLCAATSTFDQLTSIISRDALRAAQGSDLRPTYERYARPEILPKLMKFQTPVVAAVNRDTGRVDCTALVVIEVPGHEARTFANGYGLIVNDSDDTHATFRVDYSIQPAADSGQAVYSLKSATELGIMAVRAAVLKEGVKQEPAPEPVAPVGEVSPGAAPFDAAERKLIAQASQAWADFRDGDQEAEQRHAAALEQLILPRESGRG